VLSGRGLCEELITRPEESYRLWCVIVCDLETSGMKRSWPTGGLQRQKERNKQTNKQTWYRAGYSLTKSVAFTNNNDNNGRILHC
jgi:hypothetical protein